MPKPTRSAKPQPTKPPSGTTSPGGKRLPLPTASEAAFERLLARFDDPTGASESSCAKAGSAPDVAGLRRESEIAPAFGPRALTPFQATLIRHDPSVESASRADGESARNESDVGAGRDGPAVSPQDRAQLAELFASSAAYLERDRFASIGEADDFFTKIVGVSFEGRQNIVAGLVSGNPLQLVREPHNPFDANAIAVRYGALQLGFIRKEIARRIAPNIDAGERYVAIVGSMTGGGERNVGVNIHVRRTRTFAARSGAATDAVKMATRELGVAQDDLRVSLIGERPLRDAQREVLERVAAGRNTLAVLGTGRGKSLCFQLPAAEGALLRQEKTLVFYPLRALANDQFDALVRRLGGFGLRILRANGSIDGAERGELDDALADGAWDVILATPEFAAYHRDAFLRPCNKPHLVVVDEAHHVFESKHRPAYGRLADLVRDLGRPQVLALTATANEDAFREIRRALGIDAWVIDPTVRENLHVADARNTSDKNAYLARELDSDGKAIVYCNSRGEVAKLAERLRGRYGPSVAFYHAGVPTAQRAFVEDLFRRGAVRLIVATSAFGEGIDLPDVRDVVLYHLNFDFTGFNQMAGRAGRDGAFARIHLLYGDSDRRINDYIIARNAPSLDALREAYRGMRGLALDGVLRMTYEDVARTLDMADGSTVGAAVQIFREGGLIDAGTDDGGRYVRFLEVSGKVDLSKTARYAEGQAERDAFERFCGLALGADVATLEQIINRPIYPDRVALLA